VAYQE